MNWKITLLRGLWWVSAVCTVFMVLVVVYDIAIGNWSGVVFAAAAGVLNAWIWRANHRDLRAEQDKANQPTFPDWEQLP